ncbi:lincomycin resistance protein LmrB [Bifidobacterium margollesii]|uniref:Lincomycin resistance protein LmrB n=1 Tax=Bifidobacterium margollesii TaxID=2020964 RepID=A0A2N5JB92_9BIFI|nr:DHA2 family efflux MFS transporter permease subunit [Bifidobacterium margollesii]PLS31474.1 lincomycin resistance protein LmrB [Bifidobacterium margollesii]
MNEQNTKIATNTGGAGNSISAVTRIMAVVLILAAGFTTMVSQQMVSPALAQMMEQMGIDMVSAQWLVSGYALVSAIMVPMSAFLVQHLSTRHLYFGAMGLFAAGSAICALAPSFWIIVIGRMVQAVGAGVVMPFSITMMMLLFTKEQRGTAMGLSSIVIGLAPAIGPTLGGVLIDAFGWRSPFVFVGSLALILALVSSFALYDHDITGKASFDALSVVLSSIGLIALLYGLSSLGDNPILAVALMAAGIALIAGFCVRQVRMTTPFLDVKVLAKREFRWAAVSTSALQGCNFALLVTLPTFLQTAMGCSATTAGLVVLPGALVGAVAGYMSGRLFDRVGVRPLVIAAVLFFVASAAGLILMNTTMPLVLISCIYALTSLAFQLTITPVKTWGVNALPMKSIQHANAVQNTLLGVGGSVGVAAVSIIGAAVSSTPGLGATASFIVIAALLVLCAVVLLVTVRDRAQDSEVFETRMMTVAD